MVTRLYLFSVDCVTVRVIQEPDVDLLAPSLSCCDAGRDRGRE